MSVKHRALEIINERGLHARASHKFVLKAQEYDAEIRVEKDGMTVGGSSIMGLMMLAASQGSSINIYTEGNQADAALEGLAELVADGFGEIEPDDA